MTHGRIGLFGGAFDPPHLAHRALIASALHALELDQLLVLPTGSAWHKSRTLTEASHRLAMCQLAFGDMTGVEVDRREIDRPGSTYTIDTVEELALERPGASWFLLIGQDQYRSFTRWRRWQDLLGLVTLVVAARPEVKPEVATVLGAAEHRVPFRWLDVPLSPISSTAIRDLVAHGSPGLEALVPGPVAGYISTHSLYQQPS